MLRHPLQGTHVEKIHCLSSVQFSPVTQSCLTLLPHGLQHARPPVHLQLPEFTQTHVHRVIDAIQPSHPLQSPSPLFQPSIFSSIRIFSNESVLCIRWPMYWSFSYNISPSNEYSGLISFRILCSAFFIVQLSHPYMILEKP